MTRSNRKIIMAVHCYTSFSKLNSIESAASIDFVEYLLFLVIFIFKIIRNGILKILDSEDYIEFNQGKTRPWNLLWMATSFLRPNFCGKNRYRLKEVLLHLLN